jgi:hypothetical protein
LAFYIDISLLAFMYENGKLPESIHPCSRRFGVCSIS